MRYLITGAGIAVALLCSSCSVVRHMKASAESKKVRTEQVAIDLKTSRTLTTEYLGDSLAGRVPLPYTVPKPATWKINAGGIDLQVTLKDSTLEYLAIAKPVARSTLSNADSLVKLMRLNEEALQTSETYDYKKRMVIPWWIWLILVVIAGFTLLRIFNKIKFPF